MNYAEQEKQWERQCALLFQVTRVGLKQVHCVTIMSAFVSPGYDYRTRCGPTEKMQSVTV
jgi:hypothetical protein